YNVEEHNDSRRKLWVFRTYDTKDVFWRLMSDDSDEDDDATGKRLCWARMNESPARGEANGERQFCQGLSQCAVIVGDYLYFEQWGARVGELEYAVIQPPTGRNGKSAALAIAQAETWYSSK
ncbi:unnamed protein product, partial [Pleuronectes platessa]